MINALCVIAVPSREKPSVFALLHRRREIKLSKRLRQAESHWFGEARRGVDATVRDAVEAALWVAVRRLCACAMGAAFGARSSLKRAFAPSALSRG
jgi:hypothetical protein